LRSSRSQTYSKPASMSSLTSSGVLATLQMKS